MSLTASAAQERERTHIQNIKKRTAVEEDSRRQRKRPRWRIIASYWSLAVAAFLLTLICPSTRLRHENHSTSPKILTCLVAVLFLTLISFHCVEGSDPGYLDADIIARVYEEAGLGLLGDEGEQCSEEESDCISLDHEAKSEVSPRTIAQGSDSSELESQKAYFTGSRRKMCEKCQFAPPLRAHHCRICDKCVATFDHHCTFIGTCIGERNHCRFFWFLTAQLMGFYVCSSVVGSSSFGFTSLLFNQVSKEAVMAIVAKLYLYPLSITALLIWISHAVFAVVNVTTFECGKGPKHIDYLRGTQEMDAPFSMGLRNNLILFCCQRDAICACSSTSSSQWKPILWKAPGKIVRDSEDWWNHPWQNKYWSCC